MSWGRVATHWQIVGRGSFARRVYPPVLSSCQWRHASDMRCFMHELLSTGSPHACGRSCALSWHGAARAAQLPPACAQACFLFVSVRLGNLRLETSHAQRTCICSHNYARRVAVVIPGG